MSYLILAWNIFKTSCENLDNVEDHLRLPLIVVGSIFFYLLYLSIDEDYSTLKQWVFWLDIILGICTAYFCIFHLSEVIQSFVKCFKKFRTWAVGQAEPSKFAIKILLFIAVSIIIFVLVWAIMILLYASMTEGTSINVEPTPANNNTLDDDAANKDDAVDDDVDDDVDDVEKKIMTVSCKKMNITVREDLNKQLLIDVLKYHDEDISYTIREIDLVNELAMENTTLWESVATELGLNHTDISQKAKEISQFSFVEISRRLFRKLHQNGDDWDAYIDRFNKTGKLNGTIDDLKSMLKCKNLRLSKHDAVKEFKFYCNKTYLNLIEDVAPCWKEVAEAFKVENLTNYDDDDLRRLSASIVLRNLYASGYKGQLGWQGVLDVLRDAGGKRTHARLETALKCVRPEDIIPCMS